MSIYTELFGLKSIVNAAGTMTDLGGSLMAPETVEAMRRAAEEWVDLPQLLNAASNRVAELLDAPAALITSGTAAANTLASAAVMTGTDERRVAALPHPEGFPNEIVIQRGHFGSWIPTYRASGATIVPAEAELVVDRNLGGLVLGVTARSVEAVIGDKTCALAFIRSWESVQYGMLDVPEMARIARRRGLPLIVDAAAQVPPIGTVKRLLDEGADLVCLSGGKAIRGPNDTGIVAGRPDLVEACKFQAAPNTRGIGRGFKVSKEQIVGLVIALRLYVESDADERLAAEHARVDLITGELSGVSNVTLQKVFPDETGLPVPRLRIRLDERALGKSASEVLDDLKEGDPEIRLRGGYTSAGILVVDVTSLREGEAELVAARLRRALTSR